MSIPPSECLPVDQANTTSSFDFTSPEHTTNICTAINNLLGFVDHFLHFEHEAREALRALGVVSQYVESKYTQARLSGSNAGCDASPKISEDPVSNPDALLKVVAGLAQNVISISGVRPPPTGKTMVEHFQLENTTSPTSPKGRASPTLKPLILVSKAKQSHTRSQSDTSSSLSQRRGRQLPAIPLVYSSRRRRNSSAPPRSQSPPIPLKPTLTSVPLPEPSSIHDTTETTPNDYEHTQYAIASTETEEDPLVPTIVFEPPSREQTLDVPPAEPFDCFNNFSPITACGTPSGVDRDSYMGESDNSSNFGYEPLPSSELKEADAEQPSSVEHQNGSVSRGRTLQRGEISNRRSLSSAKPSPLPTPSPVSQRKPSLSADTRPRWNSSTRLGPEPWSSDENLRRRCPSHSPSPVSRHTHSALLRSVSTHARSHSDPLVPVDLPRVVRPCQSNGVLRTNKSPIPNVVRHPDNTLPTTTTSDSSKPVQNHTRHRAHSSVELPHRRDDDKKAPVPTLGIAGYLRPSLARSRDSSCERSVIHTKRPSRRDEQRCPPPIVTNLHGRENSLPFPSFTPSNGAEPAAPDPGFVPGQPDAFLDLPSPHSEPAEAGCDCEDQACDAQCAEAQFSRTLRLSLKSMGESLLDVRFDSEDELSASQLSSDSEDYSFADTKPRRRNFMADLASRPKKQRRRRTESSRSLAEESVRLNVKMALHGRNGIDYVLDEIVKMRETDGRGPRD